MTNPTKQWQDEAERYCETCKHYSVYNTGFDEYPANTAICYCKLGHWDNGVPTNNYLATDCPDHETTLPTAPKSKI